MCLTLIATRIRSNRTGLLSPPFCCPLCRRTPWALDYLSDGCLKLRAFRLFEQQWCCPLSWRMGQCGYEPAAFHCSGTQSCPTLCDPMDSVCQASCPSPSPGVCSNSRPIELVMPSNHFILCCPLLLCFIQSYKLASITSIHQAVGKREWKEECWWNEVERRLMKVSSIASEEPAPSKKCN